MYFHFREHEAHSKKSEEKSKKNLKTTPACHSKLFGKHHVWVSVSLMWFLETEIECFFRGKIEKKNRKMNVWYDDVPSLHS